MDAPDIVIIAEQYLMALDLLSRGLECSVKCTACCRTQCVRIEIRDYLVENGVAT